MDKPKPPVPVSEKRLQPCLNPRRRPPPKPRGPNGPAKAIHPVAEAIIRVDRDPIPSEISWATVQEVSSEKKSKQLLSSCRLIILQHLFEDTEEFIQHLITAGAPSTGYWVKNIQTIPKLYNLSKIKEFLSCRLSMQKLKKTFT